MKKDGMVAEHAPLERERPSGIPSGLSAALAQARQAGHGLLLLTEGGRPERFPALARALDLPYVNVSLELAHRLLDVPARRRPAEAPDVLAACLGDGGGAVAAGRLGLLHWRELQLPALDAVLRLARTRVILAEWQGALEGGRLVYARPDHDEYRTWPVPPVPIFTAAGPAAERSAS